jgi:ribosomal protein S18 acetylase RimI-like enzyme
MRYLKKFEKFIYKEVKDSIPDSFYIKGDFFSSFVLDDKEIGSFHYRIENDIFNLIEIQVSDKFRGMKYGDKIMQEVINKAKELNKKKIILEVLSYNSRAINLYKKYGFKEYKSETFFIKMELYI